MLRELVDSWRRMRTIASGEWVAAAGHAAVLLGPDAPAVLGAGLAAAPHHTAWSRAATASVEGAQAGLRGEADRAATWHLDAAERYTAVGSLTDRAFALSAACRALPPDAVRTAAARTELAEFVERNRATALLPH
jgi:hypothetical protein